MSDYDIIGGDLAFVGEDDLDIIGADEPGGLSEGERRSAAKEKLRQQGVALQERGPTKARCYPLGFEHLNVPAGNTVTVTSQPQVAFRVERLVVPSDIAGSFIFQDVIVGKNSQFANDQPVPARVFDEGGFGMRLRGDTAQTTMNVSLRVTNISGAQTTFRAAVVGTAVE